MKLRKDEEHIMAIGTPINKIGRFEAEVIRTSQAFSSTLHVLRGHKQALILKKIAKLKLGILPAGSPVNKNKSARDKS